VLKERGGEVLDGKEAIAQYKEWYFEFYGVKPTEKLIETFCKIKGIDIEQVREQNREATKVEEGNEGMMKHSELPWKVERHGVFKSQIIDTNGKVIANDVDSGMTADYIVEVCNNYEALNTNYQNLLGEFEEVSSIAKFRSEEIEELSAMVAKMSTNIGKLLNILDYYKDLLSPSDIAKLKEIKKEVRSHE
jgi:archaellum component FlaC